MNDEMILNKYDRVFFNIRHQYIQKYTLNTFCFEFILIYLEDIKFCIIEM